MDELLAIYIIGMLFPAYVVLYAAFILKEPAEDLKRLQQEGTFIYALLVLKCVLERSLIYPFI